MQDTAPNIKKINLCKCFRLCWDASLVWFSCILLITLAGLVTPYLQIISIAEFIDTALNILNHNVKMSQIIQPILLVIFVLAYNQLGNKVAAVIWLKIELELKQRLSLSIIEKYASLKYSYIENPEVLNRIKWVSDETEVKICKSVRNILESLLLGMRVATVILLIFSKSPMTAVLISAVIIPLIYLAVKVGNIIYKKDVKVAEEKRKYDYYNNVLGSRECADERNLFQYSGFMTRKWEDYYDEFRKLDLKAYMNSNLRIESGSIVTAVMSILIALILLVPYYQGVITIGLFMSVMTSVFELIESMSFQFVFKINDMVQNYKFRKDFNYFLSLEEEPVARDPACGDIKFESLEFVDLSFKYPGTNTYILNDLSMRLEAGKHYAFVGLNGAGKTTITKLLLGLYREYEGEILLNGKELREYPLSSLKGLYGVVFQDFAKYEISLWDNIKLGAGVNNREKEELFQISGVKDIIDNLPDKENTMLGKLADNGSDLSNGQWQRIALARAIIGNKEVHILDEPTAALDPLMESRIYDEFSRISKERTTILISHRLGSTKLADIIYVIAQGKVIEHGTHLDLMDQKAVYAEMFEKQRRWYE